MSRPGRTSAEEAATIRAARRVLVVGGGGLAAETARRACDLAEAVGAAVDCGDLEAAQVSGPTVARIGEVTAAPEELRDRADVVILWFCEAPAFLREFVTVATTAGRPRHTIAVGPRAPASSGAAHRQLAVPATAAVDLARLLHADVIGRAVPPPPGPLAAPRDVLRAAIAAAGCVALVTHHRDPVGLEPWSVVGLVRALARTKPAFEVPLVPVGVTAAVCTWRYGAAGAIARADRDGAAFRPGECDAARLIRRGEVDCVVAVGTLPERVKAALADPGAAVAVAHIAGDDASARSSLDALVAATQGRPAAGGGA